MARRFKKIYETEDYIYIYQPTEWYSDMSGSWSIEGEGNVYEEIDLGTVEQLKRFEEKVKELNQKLRDEKSWAGDYEIRHRTETVTISCEEIKEKA